MSRIIMDVSMSLDGFTAGPNIGPATPMGEGGERLHEWMFRDDLTDAVDLGIREEKNKSVGAALIGRRTFDIGLELWGGTPWAGVPCFVVTNRPQVGFVGDNGGEFWFGGLEAAAQRAKEAAGDCDVQVLGATVAGQLLQAGLLDEVFLHLVPVMLGAGTPLFGGVQADL